MRFWPITGGNYAPANATYDTNATGSSLIVDDNECVGCHRHVMFNQVFGKPEVGGTIHLGNNAGGKGSFHLYTGTTLAAEKLVLGNAAGASGTFTYNDGIATFSRSCAWQQSAIPPPPMPPCYRPAEH